MSAFLKLMRYRKMGYYTMRSQIGQNKHWNVNVGYFLSMFMDRLSLRKKESRLFWCVAKGLYLWPCVPASQSIQSLWKKGHYFSHLNHNVFSPHKGSTAPFKPKSLFIIYCFVDVESTLGMYQWHWCALAFQTADVSVTSRLHKVSVNTTLNHHICVLQREHVVCPVVMCCAHGLQSVRVTMCTLLSLFTPLFHVTYSTSLGCFWR